jgi:site-specific DNA recombinase
MPTPPRKRRDPDVLRGLRFAPYLRVSRADEGDKHTPEAERSTSTQRRVYTQWASRTEVQTVDEYPDPDISASRFAQKKYRPQFERMKEDIAAGKLDGVWFWEISRQQRNIAVFAELRDLCRKHGVLWVIRDRVHDPADNRDMMPLGFMSMIGEDESERLSVRVTDGKESSALKGKRAGRPPYGYKRIFDPATGEVAGDVKDEPAASVVEEIFRRISEGDSVTAIRKDLTARRVPIPGGGRQKNNPGYVWANSTILYMASNPAYIGRRVYHALEHGTRPLDRIKATLEGVETRWPRLVSDELFFAVQKILSSPVLPDNFKNHKLAGRKRKTTRNGPRESKWLLSSLITCAECGGTMIRKPAYGRFAASYACRDKACTGTPADALDDYAEELILDWLSDPKRAARLLRDGSSSAAKQARAEAEEAGAELNKLYADVRAGLVSARVATEEEERLTEKIQDAEQREQAASLPGVLKGLIGERAREGWANTSMASKRLVVSTVARIQVHKIGRNAGFPGHKAVHPAYRVSWTWLLPPPGETIPPLDFTEVVAEARKRRAVRPRALSPATRAGIARLLLASPELADRRIAELGGHDKGAVGIVRHEMEDAGEIPVWRRWGRSAPVNHGYKN